MSNKIRCEKCRFASKNKVMSTHGWKAYECSNYNSEFYKCLLNIDINGNKQNKITWRGCKYAKPNYDLE